MRGRKPTPTHLKVLQGNPGKRRLPESEAQATGELGGPPAEWEATDKAIWQELASALPIGVATGADRAAFEMLARMVGRVRSSPDKLTPAMASQIRTLCAEFGMTPSSRTRLPAPPQPSKFDGLRGVDRDPEHYFRRPRG